MTEDQRFVADNSDDGTPLVLDLRRSSLAAVVVPCGSDDQAERIAAFLNNEFSPLRSVREDTA